jgi:hypothetical protein
MSLVQQGTHTARNKNIVTSTAVRAVNSLPSAMTI